MKKEHKEILEVINCVQFNPQSDEYDQELVKESLPGFLQTIRDLITENEKASSDLELSENIIRKHIQEKQKLQAFKEYVHERLDKMGVPADPEPEKNKEHGCRIEGRLNYISKKLDLLQVSRTSFDNGDL